MGRINADKPTGRLRIMDGVLQQEFKFYPRNAYDPNLRWKDVPSYETPDVQGRDENESV